MRAVEAALCRFLSGWYKANTAATTLRFSPSDLPGSFAKSRSESRQKTSVNSLMSTSSSSSLPASES
eukprot:10105339-Heterocapsa_arctica.AAC.1